MITAVDTSLLIKILKREDDAPAAMTSLELAANQGTLLVSAIVVAELGRLFKTNQLLLSFLGDMQLLVSPITEACALQAADIMRNYAKNKGDKSRIAADFLIGAHAMSHANQLLTSDAGFMRQYFKTLKVINP
jgi:predicted nucleic acid-binding protein